jgi:hypothetical protein
MARLLDAPNTEAQVIPLPRVAAASTGAPATSPTTTADWLRRVLPVAAVLLVALGMSWYFQLDATLALQKDILGHIYSEEPFITSRPVMLDELNSHLEASLGAHLVANAATEGLEVTFVKDCRVAKQVGTHLVMKGEQGPVTVIMLPESVVEDETPIADGRLSGKMIPAAGRTLVVVGNKQEPIDEYLRVLNSNLKWEY